MKLIKLGGSIITDKREYRRFNADTVRRLCREIKDSGQEVIIVHGAGSFGHVLAKKYDLNAGNRNAEQIPAVAQVCYDVRDLDSMIVKELNEAGIPAVSVPPGSCFVMEDRRLIIENDEVLRRFVELGIMPVMFGDVVLDRKLGFAILSGDQVIFVSDIDGLFDDDPKKNPSAKMYRTVDKDTLESVRSEVSVDDVTGGVYEKMRAMLRMCSDKRECILVNGNAEGRLLSLLKGEETICTKATGGII